MKKCVLIFLVALLVAGEASARDFPGVGLDDQKNYASYSGLGGYSGLDGRGIPFGGLGGGIFGTGGLGGTSSFGGMGAGIGTMPSAGLGGIGVIPSVGGTVPGAGIGGGVAPGIGSGGRGGGSRPSYLTIP